MSRALNRALNQPVPVSTKLVTGKLEPEVGLPETKAITWGGKQKAGTYVQASNLIAK